MYATNVSSVLNITLFTQLEPRKFDRVILHYGVNFFIEKDRLTHRKYKHI